MIDENEKAYYRTNITNKYVIEIMTDLEEEEKRRTRIYNQEREV